MKEIWTSKYLWPTEISTGTNKLYATNWNSSLHWQTTSSSSSSYQYFLFDSFPASLCCFIPRPVFNESDDNGWQFSSYYASRHSFFHISFLWINNRSYPLSIIAQDKRYKKSSSRDNFHLKYKHQVLQNTIYYNKKSWPTYNLFSIFKWKLSVTSWFV